MAPRAITDVATVFAWAPPAQAQDARATAVLERCIEAASLTLEAACHRRFASASYVAWHSGSRACGAGPAARLYLADPETGFHTAPVLGSPGVIEAGTVLSTAQLGTAATYADGEYALWSAGGGSLVRASVTDGRFVPKAWVPGFSNVLTTWTAGYTPRDAEGNGTMPADVVQVCCELAWMFYREGARNGLESLIQQGVNVTFVRLLSPLGRQIVDSYTLPRTPRTIER